MLQTGVDPAVIASAAPGTSIVYGSRESGVTDTLPQNGVQNSESDDHDAASECSDNIPPLYDSDSDVDSDEHIRLVVVDVFGKRYTFTARLSDTIADLKQRLYLQANIAGGDNRYFKYRSQELHDNQVLSKCNFLPDVCEILWLDRPVRGRGGAKMQIFVKVCTNSHIVFLFEN